MATTAIKAVKKWMQRGWQLEKEIRALMETKEQLKADAYRITGSVSRAKVQTSRGKGAENVWARLADFDKRITARIDELCAIKAEITDAISCVSDSEWRAILQMRYVNFEKWDKIADMVHCDRATAFRIHDRALEDVATRCDYILW